MGVLIGLACMRGAATGGTSRLYRAVLAGLDAHVATHVGASAMTRRYTAGVATAAAVMLPGTRAASRELTRLGIPLTWKDYVLAPLCFCCSTAVTRVRCEVWTFVRPEVAAGEPVDSASFTGVTSLPAARNVQGIFMTTQLTFVERLGNP